MDNQKFLLYLDKVRYNDFGCVLALSYVFYKIVLYLTIYFRLFG